jgi:hypothetical protein
MNMTTICAVLSITAHRNWEIHQIDVKSAYFNAELHNDIYMHAPPGYLKSKDLGKVLKLLQSLYGLKQAGFEWSEELEKFSLHAGYTHSQVDQAVYFRRISDKHTVITVSVDDMAITVSVDDMAITVSVDDMAITVSVDDMAITSKHLQHILHFKAKLCERFEISDLGELTWLLGLKGERNRSASTISLSQQAYVGTVIEHFHLQDVKSTSIPMNVGTSLSLEQSPSMHEETEDMQDIPYQQGIGSLMYAATSTHPDIALAVSILLQFMWKLG